MSEIYLRDLKEDVQEEIKREIAIKRLDLSEAIKNGEEIIVGEFFESSEYEIENN